MTNSSSAQGPRKDDPRLKPADGRQFQETHPGQSGREPADGEERARPRGRGPETAAGDSVGYSNPFKGGSLSNTHPSGSHIQLEGYSGGLVSGGLDWFDCSFQLEWKEEQRIQVMEVLEAAKQRCQKENVSNAFVELNSESVFRVFRSGLNRGGSRGQHFEYRLEFHGITVGLANREATNQLSNAFFQMRGRECLLIGALQGYERTKQLFQYLGATVVGEKLSRVDLCLDIAGLETARVVDLIEAQRFITLARTVHPHRELVSETTTGLVVGKKPARLVIYDKLLEQKYKADALVFQALKERRWGNQLPNQATRLEFQVCREWLLKQGISTPDDLFRLAGSLILMLTDQWFRITDHPVDRRNKNKAVWRLTRCG